VNDKKWAGSSNREMQKVISEADLTLQSLVGDLVDTISVKSLETRDAPFLGLVVSKLSPIIGNLLEKKITQILTESAAKGFHWLRQDPGFPDAVLINESGEQTGFGYEVKAWYALSTELTGRFRESRNLLSGKHVKVVIVAWTMSHIVYGTPKILGILSVDADAVASSRDSHYFKPPQYLTVEPGNTTNRTKNLQQSNVNGYRLQVDDPSVIAKAKKLVADKKGESLIPHSREAQLLANELMSRYQYRLDTNFAKVDRIDNSEIENFKSAILGQSERGRTIKEWSKLLKDLNEDEGSQKFQTASAEIQKIYDNL
jgi:hypothetical protein